MPCRCFRRCGRDDVDPQAIVGEVYAVNDVTLRLLDRLEVNGELYQRELIEVECLELPNDRLQAWTYLYLGDLRSCSPLDQRSLVASRRLNQLRITFAWRIGLIDSPFDVRMTSLV